MIRYGKRITVFVVIAMVLITMLSSSIAATKVKSYQYILEWGSKGTDVGQFLGPVGMEVDDKGNIYVCDINNHRIQMFDSKGNILMEFGQNIDMAPIGIALDKQGYIYVADMRNKRIIKFSPNGNELSSWDITLPGEIDLIYPEFSSLLDIEIDSTGIVYVVDTQFNKIKMFTENGQYISDFINEFNSPMCISIDQDDNVYVGQSDSQIYKFRSNGEFITSWELKDFLNADRPLDFPNNMPYKIDTDQKGNVYVVDFEHALVQKFDSNGNFLARIGEYGTGEGQFDMPWAVVVDAKGFVYVSEGVGEYYDLPPDGYEFIEYGLKNRIQKFH